MLLTGAAIGVVLLIVILVVALTTSSGSKGTSAITQPSAGKSGVVTTSPSLYPSFRPTEQPVTGRPSSMPSPMPTIEEVVGYWWWTWQPDGNIPDGSTLGKNCSELLSVYQSKSFLSLLVFPSSKVLSFSGWSDMDTALSESDIISARLPPNSFFTVGGGGTHGRFTKSSLSSITESIRANMLSDYAGIAFDIEEGDAGLTTSFRQLFAIAKQNDLQVMVTVSHSAPYGVPDAATMMRAFFKDTNIDFIAPQLYTDGDEYDNDYQISAGVEWSEFAKAHAHIVPSIVYKDLYQDAKSFFKTHGVHISGYIQWEQN